MNTVQDIYNKIETLVFPSSTIFIIQGGYFESNTGIDNFSTYTFETAINLGKLIEKTFDQSNIFHSILINDLGQTCSTQGCSIDKTDNVDVKWLATENLFNRFNQEKDKISIFTEKTLKNRGLRKMRKIIKKKEAQEELYSSLYFSTENQLDKWYLSSKYGSDIHLFSRINDNYIAKCPLIMGTYYSDLFTQRYLENQEHIKNMVIIDFCSFTDKDKVMKGAEVALDLLNADITPKVRKIIIPILCDTKCTNMIPLTIS